MRAAARLSASRLGSSSCWLRGRGALMEGAPFSHEEGHEAGHEAGSLLCVSPFRGPGHGAQ